MIVDLFKPQSHRLGAFSHIIKFFSLKINTNYGPASLWRDEESKLIYKVYRCYNV